MKHALVSGIAALLFPFSALAEFSYSYFELGYIGDVSLEAGSAEEDGDGLFGRLNFVAGDWIYVTAYIDEIEAEESQLDLDRFGVGFGIHNNVESTVGLFATITYEDLESEIDEDKGLGFNAGARYIMQEDFEAYGGVTYASYGSADATFFQIGGVWHFHKAYALLAEFNTGEISLDDFAEDLERDDVRIALRVQF